MNGFKIAPLLILPIVENAFKHVSNFKEASSNKIYISLSRTEKRNFVVEAINTYDKTSFTHELIKSGGLGVQNLKRRLELLYPSKYELNVEQQSNVYKNNPKNCNTMMNCLVVDDEPIGRKGLVEHIKQIDFFKPAGRMPLCHRSYTMDSKQKS